MLEIIVLIATSILNVILGLAVFIKNPRSMTNRFFLFLTSAIVSWSVVNYISVHPILFSQIVWVRFVLFFSALLSLAIYLTLHTLPHIQLTPKAKFRAKLATLATFLIMCLTLTPFVFSRLETSQNGVEPIPSPGIAVFMIYTLYMLISGLYTFIKKFHNATGKSKNQLRLILYGIAGTFGLIVTTNFLLVVVFNVTFLIPFGPAFTLIFSGAFAYAIIKHRLFDIRAAVARTLAYLLSLGSIGAVYGTFVLGLAELLVKDFEQTVYQRAFYIGFALLTSFIYQPVKKFFDRLTNRIFFQDAYEPQKFIDQLNKTLVTFVEIDSLLKKSSEILEMNLKNEFVAFCLYETKYTPKRMIGSHGKYTSTLEASELKKLTDEIHHKVILSDELNENGVNRELYNVLQDNNISAVIRLSGTFRNTPENIGFLLLGPKKSGNAYNETDVNVLTIISNELVIALENALRFEEIANFNLTLQQKVDDATRQMRRTNEKLKALDETKDEFISMASHQLRTPLTSVKGYLSMVLDGDTGKITANQRSMLEQAFTSSQRMVYLISDLLNVSRLRTGKFVIEPVASDLAEVVEGEMAQLKETAAARGLELVYEKPKDFPTLMLDETKIRQVIMNFADNAIYYTPSGGHIKVELKDLGSSVEFTVTDDGLGVPKHEQHHLFNKFYRAGNAKKARPDGTGLGLFMAKKVIVAQGGSIIFKSQEGKGSTFGFSFPKAKLMPPKIEKS